VKFLVEELLKYPDYLYGWCKLAEYTYLVTLLLHAEMYSFADSVSDYLLYDHPLTKVYNTDILVEPHDMVALGEFLSVIERLEFYNMSMHGIKNGVPLAEEMFVNIRVCD